MFPYHSVNDGNTSRQDHTEIFYHAQVIRFVVLTHWHMHPRMTSESPWKLVAAFWYIKGCWMILVCGAVLNVGVIITVCC